MKTTTKTQRLALLTAIALPAASFLLAQGPLPPPGAPAPTMKTLDQVEPRTPISSVPFTISTPGHFYLTKSLTTTGNGITINADKVVLDLGGFVLTGNGTGNGIHISTGTEIVTVRNGKIAAFNVGIQINVLVIEILLEDLAALGCNGSGIIASGNANGGLTKSVFRRLILNGNGGNGASIGASAAVSAGQNVIQDCTFIGNTGGGLLLNSAGNLVLGCRASGNATNYFMVAGNRGGVYVVPAVNAAVISGSSGGPGSGTTDPFANLSF